MDVVVVADDPPSIASFHDQLGAEPLAHHPSVLLYEPADWALLWTSGSLFVQHVIVEGRILRDDGLIKAAAPFHPKMDYREDIADQLSKLRLYNDLSRFDDNFLFVLSHLFSILKNVCVFSLAQVGILEFNKLRSIDRFFETFAQYRAHEEELSSLYAFYVLASKGPYAVPRFSYRGCAARVRQYRDMLQTMRVHA